MKTRNRCSPLPRYVIKAGHVLVEEGELREPCDGETLHVAPEFDDGVEASIREWFEQYYSIRFRNYPVTGDYLLHPREVACGK